MTRTFYILGFALALALCAAPPALAAGQTVTIDGNVSGNVYGNGPGPNGTNPNIDPADLLDPNNNTVIINGGEVDDSVYGGYADGAPDSTATHNTVTISGSPVFDADNTALYGGDSSVGVNSDFFTGNTLNVWNYTGSPVYSVQNFQYYNFILPASRQGLTVTGTAHLNNYTPASAATIGSTVTGVSIIGGAAPVQAGTSVTLIDASAGRLTPPTSTRPKKSRDSTARPCSMTGRSLPTKPTAY